MKKKKIRRKRKSAIKKKIKRTKTRKKKIARRRIRKRKIQKRGKIVTEEKIKALIEKGKERGFITPPEILYFFPRIEKDIKGLESIYEELEKE